MVTLNLTKREAQVLASKLDQIRDSQETDLHLVAIHEKTQLALGNPVRAWSQSEKDAKERGG